MAADAPPPEFACPMCGEKVDAKSPRCPACGADFAAVTASGRPPKVRPRRTLRGAYDDAAIDEIARIPGVGRARAKELCRAGYTATEKLKAAKEEDLAKVPGVGPGGARVIKESLQFIAIFPQRRTKEQVMAAECRCPLCGCVTSLFAERCHDCGADFEPTAELDDLLRGKLALEGAKAELAFYEIRLMQDPTDARLWYARGCLVRDMGNIPEAGASFDRALGLVPSGTQILLARAGMLVEENDVAEAAKHLRAAVSDLLQEPAEILAEDAHTTEAVSEAHRALDTLANLTLCPTCGAAIPEGASACPSCHPAPPPAPPSVEPKPVPRRKFA